MAIDTSQLGQPITHADADVMFNRLVQIKQRSCEKIRTALAGDDEAIRHYCGRKGTISFNEDLAFLFTKQSLIKVLTRILSDKADGLILFNAVRGPNDSIVNGEATDVSGRPTVIMFPFKETPSFDTDDTIVNLLDDGDEHPGTGSSDGSIVFSSGVAAIPATFNLSEIHLNL